MRTFLAPIVLAAACAAPTEDLVASLPQAALLTPGLSSDGPADGDGRPLAVLYLATRRTSAQLNGLVTAALGTVGQVFDQPPAEQSPGRAVWAPLNSPLSPAVYRVIAEGSDEGIVQYHLDGRPRAGSDFRQVLIGTAAPGHGTFAIDFTVARALDPASEFDQDGALTVEYKLDDTGAAVHLAMDAGTTGEYRWTQRPDGSGSMSFVAATEMGNLALEAQWTASGAGRADAIGVSECWDASFQRVFLLAPGHIEGDPALCVVGTDG